MILARISNFPRGSQSRLHTLVTETELIFEVSVFAQEETQDKGQHGQEEQGESRCGGAHLKSQPWEVETGGSGVQSHPLSHVL